jgi:endogenous inhibitor of DNA gyrase (YacG/DUF329 family)
MKTGNVWEDFTWETSVGGYHWEELPQGLALLRNVDGPTERVVTYRPFSRAHATLFRTFAGLDLTPDAVLAFANQYGMLGAPVVRHLLNDYPPTVPGQMDGAHSVRRLAKGFPGRLGEIFDLNKPTTDVWCWVEQIRRLSEFVRTSQVLRDEPRIAGSLLISANMALAMTAPPHLEWSDSERAFHLRLRPSSLIGALWLQAVVAVSEDKRFPPCPICGTPLEISRSGGARTDAVFCSNKCKSRDYRQRRDKALRLALRKRTPAQIALKLGTNIATVRRWLKAAKD